MKKTRTTALLLLVRAGALASMVVLSSCQMYSSGIGKATHLVSDAPAALSWLTAHLPVYHDHAGLDCTSMPEPFNETFCPCGQAGRTGLFCPDCPPCRNCQPWSHGGGFGLHTISYNASAPHIARPTPRAVSAGGVAAIEAQVTRKLRAASAHEAPACDAGCCCGVGCSCVSPRAASRAGCATH